MQFFIKILFRHFIFFLILLIDFSFSSLWAAPPVISVNTLFSDVVISTEYEGWMVKGTGPLALWPQTELRQAMLAEMNRQGTFILTYPLTEKPVQVIEENKAFFSDLLEVPCDGTFMALKYLFLPKSVLSPVSQDPGSPHYFYLVKKAPAKVEFQAPPSSDAITLKITNLQSNHLLFHDATRLMIAGEQEQGQALMLTCADAGNPQAQFEMGTTYYQEGSVSQAIHYLKLSADQGNSLAQYDYALILDSGLHTPGNTPDFVKALEYYRRAADQGHVEAIFRYATMLYDGEGTPGNTPDFLKALEYYGRSADLGNAQAQYCYATMLYNGEGTPEGVSNLPKALKYYRLAANQGDAEAQYNYAYLLRNGEGTPQNVPDLKTALEYYRRSADQDNADAQFSYAEMLYDGQGTPKNAPDLVSALEYYHRSADQGEPGAQFSYAEMLRDGKGTLGNVPDLGKALQYFRLAAAQGNLLALQALREMNITFQPADVFPNDRIERKRKAG